MALITHNISLPTGKLMQCGGYWQELPVGTESEWKAKEAESGAQRAKSKKKPKS